MMVTINIDGTGSKSASGATAAAPTSSDAMDGGAATGANIAAEATVEDVGGPPAWLLEAVSLASSADNPGQADDTTAIDGGAGPA